MANKYLEFDDTGKNLKEVEATASSAGAGDAGERRAGQRGFDRRGCGDRLLNKAAFTGNKKRHDRADRASFLVLLNQRCVM